MAVRCRAALMIYRKCMEFFLFLSIAPVNIRKKTVFFMVLMQWYVFFWIIVLTFCHCVYLFQRNALFFFRFVCK